MREKKVLMALVSTVLHEEYLICYCTVGRISVCVRSSEARDSIGKYSTHCHWTMTNNGHRPKHVKAKCFLTHIKLVTLDGLLPLVFLSRGATDNLWTTNCQFKRKGKWCPCFQTWPFSVDFVMPTLNDIGTSMGQLTKVHSLPSDNEVAATAPIVLAELHAQRAPKVTTDMQGSPACIATVLQNIS